MGSSDRTAELRALDGTKSGVQGLIASGCAQIPRIFLLPPADRVDPSAAASAGDGGGRSGIPVINLGISNKKDSIEAMRRASAEWGFFQVTGHTVPQESMDAILRSVRDFHERGGEKGEKERLYSREPDKAVKYHCNFDLYQSRVANWRDTLYCRMAPDPPAPGDLPDSCREAIFEYSKHMMKLGNKLFELLSEALGLDPTHLTEIECNQGQILLCHYYPPCPEPELAIGTSRHSDSGFLTILLQDNIGGLQIFHENEWVDVPYIPGAVIVNISDLLQLISNDKFKSVEHRVVAKKVGPRVSIACFFSTHFHPASTRMYGPIKELLTADNPPLYRETLVRDFVTHYYSLGLDGKSAISHFRL